MSGRVNDIDLRALIHDRRVLRKNRNPALSLDLIAIHDKITSLCDFPKPRVGLAQQCVNESCFPVINVSDDCYIPYIHIL